MVGSLTKVVPTTKPAPVIFAPDCKLLVLVTVNVSVVVPHVRLKPSFKVASPLTFNVP